MKTYNEKTGLEIENPDLEAGYTYPGQRYVGTERVILKGTVELYPPGGLGYDKAVYEDCNLYHEYTEEDRQEELNKKETELSNACNSAISAGSPVVLSDKSTKQFSYTIEDQANVSEMFNAILMGATSYPYHANGESCMMYSAVDIMAIYSTLSSLKTAQITYFNQLRQYMKTLQTVPEIQAVTYGQALEGEYLKTYNSLISQAAEEMKTVLDGITSSVGNNREM